MRRTPDAGDRVPGAGARRASRAPAECPGAPARAWCWCLGLHLAACLHDGGRAGAGVAALPAAWRRHVVGGAPEGGLRRPGRGGGPLACGPAGRTGRPVSTTGLARRTGLTPGGASQHLKALRTVGLVSSHRVGRQVLYALTRAGEALVAAAGA
ncbi:MULTISPECIES: helix-turn-helix domain-containing protein [Streptomyces]|uniref:helix-turn-helix domain-containing protein n=1 Tax=Streptomyces TaxID=1883 RepID=UPI0037D996A4